ncbi:MAG: DM13 domain-containing protein [Cyanobacteria bacterium J06627_8]
MSAEPEKLFSSYQIFDTPLRGHGNMKLKEIATFGLSLLLLGGVGPMVVSPVAVRAESLASNAKQASTVLESGTFVTSEGQSDPTTGSATIIEMNGSQFVQLSGDFSTATGPDVEVILYEHADVPVSIEGTGAYVSLGQLTEFEGQQLYAIPEGVDIAQFDSIGIWCEQFDVTFGYASL